MREGMGKYRGISIDSGKWLYGCLLHDAMKEKASYYILSDDVMNFDEYEAVKDGSVGQFTGLRDKNGVDVFEGDVLFDPDQNELDLIVEYDNRVASFFIVIYGIRGALMEFGWAEDAGGYGKVDAEPMSQDDTWMKVIGNIHDNPELLEATK